MPLSLSIAPVQVELVRTPGQNASQVYNFKNDSDIPLTLQLSVEAWQPSGNDGSVAYTGGEQLLPFRFSILNADRDSSLDVPFTIAPGKTQQIVLGIQNVYPQLTGDYYYTVFANQLASPGELANQSSSLGKIGSHLIISIPTTKTSEPLQLQIAKIPGIIDGLFQPIAITGNFFNPSSSYQKIQGQINLVKNKQIVQSLNLSPDLVLSQNFRRLQCVEIISSTQTNTIPCTFNPPLWPGLYQLQITGPNLPNQTQNILILPYLILIPLLLFCLTFTIKFTHLLDNLRNRIHI